MPFEIYGDYLFTQKIHKKYNFSDVKKSANVIRIRKLKIYSVNKKIGNLKVGKQFISFKMYS